MNIRAQMKYTGMPNAHSCPFLPVHIFTSRLQLTGHSLSLSPAANRTKVDASPAFKCFLKTLVFQTDYCSSKDRTNWTM